MRAGERFAAEFGLGDVPATRLSQSMERQLGILVLMVDAERGGFCGEPEDSRRNPTTAWAWLADLGRRTTQATRSQSVSSVRFSDSWSRCLRAPKASRLMPVASSIAVMARHAGPVLVDTNIILESYRVGSWRALAGGYNVETVEGVRRRNAVAVGSRPEAGRRLDTLRARQGQPSLWRSARVSRATRVAGAAATLLVSKVVACQETTPVVEPEIVGPPPNPPRISFNLWKGAGDHSSSAAEAPSISVRRR